jgi:hypothetical protein
MVVGALSSRGDVIVVLWLAGVSAIFTYGWKALCRRIDELDRRIAAPLEREAVTILDKQPRGRNRSWFVTVANAPATAASSPFPSSPGS